MSKMTYSEQLRHPLWQRKRLEVLDKAEWSCQACGAKDQTLHVHHKRYVKGRMAWQYESAELAALCETCHQETHHADDVFREVLAYAPIAGPFSVREAMALVVGFLGLNDDSPDHHYAPLFPANIHEANIGNTCRSLSTYLDTKTICLLGQSLADPVFAQDLIKALSDADERLEEQIRKEMGEAP